MIEHCSPDSELPACPFCGGSNIDPKGWASINEAGPACDDCGATAESTESWCRRAPAQAVSSSNSPGECLRLKYGYACDELASAISERDEARYNLAHAVPQTLSRPERT